MVRYLIGRIAALKHRAMPVRTVMHAMLLGAVVTAAISSAPAARSQELPIPASNWVSAGAATQSITGATMNINQQTQNATLNWEKFNIGRQNTVNFQQPSSSSVALNKVRSADPSQILGALNANGEVYIINQNGIVFGEGAQVNVRGLVSSTLNLTPSAETLGIAGAIQSGQAAFEAATDSNGAVVSKDIVIQKGARITTPSGGRVFAFAPNVTNEGEIKAPDGQVALAAGQKVYLTSNDASIRGLVVEVDGGGVVTNGNAANAGVADPNALTGQLSAERGNVSLVGMAVNQLGRASATTTVRSGGSVRLVARNSIVNGTTVTANQGGNVRLGRGSVTEANPEAANPDTDLVTNAQPRGKVEIAGNKVVLEGGSAVVARGGNVNVVASSTGDNGFDKTQVTDSRVVMEAGSQIDVSGLDVDLPADRNALTVRLQGSQLQDLPVQRDSSLRGKTVTIDLRRKGTRADGSAWVGTPLADLRNDALAVRQTVAERNAKGGSVSFESQGDVVVSGSATVNVAGGAVRYANGLVSATRLVRQGRIVDIADADPNLVYDGIFGEMEVEHPKWGPTDVYKLFVGTPSATDTGGGGGYIEGLDAGQIALTAERIQLSGDFNGGTRRGKYQRQPTATITADAVRPFDQAPQRGTLVIGRAGELVAERPDFDTGSISFVRRGQSSGTSDISIPVDYFGDSGFGTLKAYTSKSILLPADIGLDLGSGGRLDIVAGQVTIAGDIVARGGEVDVLARETSDSSSTGLVTVEAGSEIDVSGRWVNDSSLLNSGNPVPAQVAIEGGNVVIEGESVGSGVGGLNMRAGSRVRADGGGWLTAAGRLRAGDAGSIELVAKRGVDAAPAISIIDATLSAYGLEQGGDLSLTASGFCIAEAQCASANGNGQWLRPGFFGSGGFGHYELVADGGGIEVPAGTVVDFRQQNLLPGADFSRRASGSELRDFAVVGELPDFVRKPVDVDLIVKARTANSFNDAALRAAGFLDIGTNSRLITEAGGSIHAASDTRMFVDGTLQALAGDIRLTLTSGIKGSRFAEFMPSQTLWLGQNARLLAGGAVQNAPSPNGLRTGEVLDAGSVSLQANSGYLVAESGSAIDVSGTAAVFDVAAPGSLGPASPKVSAGDGGQIALSAAEGILFDGAMSARAGADGARAGSLTVTLDAQGRNDADLIFSAASLNLPETARRIVVTETDSTAVPSSLRPGAAVPQQANGQARLSAADLQAGGFGDITLHARNLARDVTAPGEIAFEGNVQLSASRRLTLDAAAIATNGGDVRLAAPYVAMGNQDDDVDGRLRVANDPVSGTGSITVSGQLIDLIGNWRLNGVADTRFESSGDIRLRGVHVAGVGRQTGDLQSIGNIAFSSRQTYAPTLNAVRVAVVQNDDGTIRFSSQGPTTAPLSVGSSLAFEAANILQAGTIRAPMGKIDLRASKTLALEAGSLTSTTLEGLLVPFGRVEIGKDWVYALTKDSIPLKLVYSTQPNRGVDPFPAQQLTLTAPDVAVNPGAVIDQRGGGDLLAYEFQPGLGGTKDVLDAAVSPGTYAIVPGLSSEFAPVDAQEYQAFGLKPGDSVEITTAVGGVQPGRYALLPPRYALLPGAVLIKAVDGYENMQAGTQISPPEGGTIVPGRAVFAGGREGDEQTSGFLVRTRSEVDKLARYDVYTANQFGGDLAGARRPRDGGTTQIVAQQSLNLGGVVLAGAAPGGRGASVEIAGDRLAVVRDKNANNADAGSLIIEAAGLNALKADSLLLGGIRRQNAGSQELNITSRSVEIDEDARLQAPEVIVAAREGVRLERGSSIAGVGAGSISTDPLLLSGDGAVLRASSGAQIDLVRTGVLGLNGTLDVLAGSLLAADESLLLSSSSNAVLAGDVVLKQGSITIDTNRINLGNVGGAVDGVNLSEATLAAIDAREINLFSRTTIDLFDPVSLSAGSVRMRASGLIGRLANSGDTVQVIADRFSLSNIAGSVASSEAGSGQGGLRINAANIALGPGDVAVAGFSTTTLTGRQQIAATGGDGTNGRISVSGDLSLVAGTLTATSGSSLDVTATGAVNIAASGETVASTARPGLGADLTLAGSSVTHSGRIDLRSGNVALRATGAAATDGVTLASGSSIDVSGVSEEFADKSVSSSGGKISLISDGGNVQLDTGAILDVSGGELGGDAGELVVAASSGTAALNGGVSAEAQAGFRGGTARIDVGQMANLAAISRALAAGNMTERQQYRVRAGDIVIAAADSIQAHRISLTADTGRVVVSGTLDAAGRRGGSVELNARDDVRLTSTARVDASATATDAKGGRVALRSDAGGVLVDAGSTIDLSAGASSDPAATAEATRAERGGQLDVRVTRENILTLTDAQAANNLLALDGVIVGARRIGVEGYRRYVDSDGVIDSAEVAADAGNARYSDASAFMSNSSAIRNGLGAVANDPAFRLLAGVEIGTDASNPDLRLAADWDLSTWRFGDAVGAVSLRARGDIVLDASISDGFNGVADLSTTAAPELLSGDSWSIRLVAGSDQASANPLAVDPAGNGSIALAPGVPGSGATRPGLKAVRTGTGDIEMAAAGDITLGNRASVVYTAGKDSQQGVRLGTGRGTLENRPYAEAGGSIAMTAGGTIRGVSADLESDLSAHSDQLITSWQFRQGATNEDARGTARRAVGWTVAYERFQQGVGALAGGEVTIDAGKDVRNLSAAVGTIGRQVGGSNANSSIVEETGGGDLTVSAGQDILGGVYYVGRGEGQIRAGGDIESGRVLRDVDPTPLHTILALGDGKFDVTAGGTLNIETVVNPTLIPQSPVQKQVVAARGNSFFSTYGTDSAVSLLSKAGDVVLHNNRGGMQQSGVFDAVFLDAESGTESLALVIYPPALSAAALRGDLQVNGEMTLFPSSSGDLQLLADGSVAINSNVALSDSERDTLPTVSSAAPAFLRFDRLDPANVVSFAATPAHAGGDAEPARVVARTGDIARTTNGFSQLFLAKRGTIVAGRDIVSLNAIVQNNNDGDVTLVRAGRDLVYPTTRNVTTGLVDPSVERLDVQGPGRLLIETGRDVDLGAAGGITTSGDTRNPALADKGANVSIFVGMNGGSPNLDGFSERYLGSASSSVDPVLDAFFGELRETGRANAALPNSERNYRRGDDAIATLFDGQQYGGSMNLFFSRIYTLDGGDIDLLVPNGKVNVGLATPPASFGISKSASELGIVAQSTGDVRAYLDGNFDVNESRVFAADGGSILVWSSSGDIDAGRGAKSAISAPPPIITVDPKTGTVNVVFPPALTGSGLRTLTTTPGTAFGSVDLITPKGIVNASEAGIESQGNVTIAAVQVLGADNIKVGGVSTGVPTVDTGGLGGLAGVGDVASAATKSVTEQATSGLGDEDDSKASDTAKALASALSFISVEFLGYGEG